MKKFILLTIVCLSAFASKAQMNCTQMCVLNVAFDTVHHQLDITISSSSSNGQINYPIVQYVVTPGDTAGNPLGNFYLFAQLPGDTVIHVIPTALPNSAYFTPFTGTVVVTDKATDTIPTICTFAYPSVCSVGINEAVAKNNIYVYPNPATDNITVDIEKPTSSAVITLMDMLGNTVRSYTTSQNKLIINRDGLESGIYFISVTAGNKRYTNKLVIK